MKIYKITQDTMNSNTPYYRGSSSPETKPIIRDFPGVYFTKDPEVAKNWGKYVATYKIKPTKIYIPDNNEFSYKNHEIMKSYLQKYGPHNPNQKIPQKWQNMGASTSHLTEPDINLLSQLMLFPTPNWISFLKELGYEGFQNDEDLFIFNPQNAQYVGQYKK